MCVGKADPADHVDHADQADSDDHDEHDDHDDHADDDPAADHDADPVTDPGDPSDYPLRRYHHYPSYPLRELLFNYQ